MAGIRVLELAEYTFAPVAGAVLADWGAEVIKVEHAVRGDAQRGVRRGTASAVVGSFHVTMENSNRGKRSIGLDLQVPSARPILEDLVRWADVVVTSYLPAARRRLGVEVDDLRRINPMVIYACGSGYGTEGPDAERRGYDRTAFWSRGGGAMGTTPPDAPRMIDLPAGAYGDNLGGLTIAGGIAAALLARERTGEPSTVDVSLLGVSAWGMSLGIGSALLTGAAHRPEPLSAVGGVAGNPTVGYFRTSDDRWIALMMLQPGRYWADTCAHLGLDDLIDDPRFATAELIMDNAAAANVLVCEAVAARPYAYWCERLATLEGPWSLVQDALEVGTDPQVRANGYIRPVVDLEGNGRELVANPVQFDRTPPDLVRGPQFAEHTDEILLELGLDYDRILELKIDGAVT